MWLSALATFASCMVLMDVLTHAHTLFLLQVFRGDYFGPADPNLASSARGVPASLSDTTFAFVTAVCWVHVADVEVRGGGGRVLC
jgi:hypothetical protein